MPFPSPRGPQPPRGPTSGKREPPPSEAPLGASVADTVDSLAEFHRAHYREASRLQQSIDWLTEKLGRPIVVIVLLSGIACWAAYAAATTGGGIDKPAFGWLELFGTLAALVVSVLILVTQRREDQLADRRAQLILELALLADLKSSKIISLLEELRRDHPDVADRIDHETDDLATPADPKAVLAAIEEQTAVRTKREGP
jgi:uncharacterized membrane protein